MVDLGNLVQTLTSPHHLDRYLELLKPTLSVRDARAEVVAVDRSVPGSVTLTLRPNRHWKGHLAGQYVEVGVVIDGVRHTRCYSPVGPQGSRSIRFTVKRHPEGLVSRYLHRAARVGMVVSLLPAAGVFRLPEVRPDRLLLISGGSGITPVLSMLHTLAEEGYPGEVVFLHYARSEEAVPHRAELATITQRYSNFRVEYRYPAGSDEHFGSDELARIAPWFADAEAYVCGPAPLMDAVRKVYAEAGVEERVNTEEFTVTLTPMDAAEVYGTTDFVASGVQAQNEGATLLEQAEAAGLTPEYGCRMGICFSCTAVRRTGCTRNVRTGDIDSDPDQPIQLCISAAVGDVEIDI